MTEWKATALLPGHMVSDDGDVIGADGRRPYMCADTRGYQRVTIRRDGERFDRRVHRLVCEAFHGPPRQGQEVCHVDGDRLNNRASNLRWGTRSENVRDAMRHGTFIGDTTAARKAKSDSRGHRNPNAKFTPDEVKKIRESGLGARKVAALYNCSRSTAHYLLSGKSYAE